MEPIEVKTGVKAIFSSTSKDSQGKPSDYQQDDDNAIRSRIGTLGKKGKRVKSKLWQGKNSVARTVVFEEIQLLKLGQISLRSGLPLKDVMYMALDSAISSYEKKNGVIVLSEEDDAVESVNVFG